MTSCYGNQLMKNSINKGSGTYNKFRYYKEFTCFQIDKKPRNKFMFFAFAGKLFLNQAISGVN
jgi:hypothetical protein